MDAQEFRRLLLRHKEGDECAFEKLYEYCNPKLIGTAFLYLQDKDMAISVADDILVKLYNDPEKYSEIKSPADWLFIVAKNGSLDLLRKEQNRRKHESTLKSDEIAVSMSVDERLDYYALLKRFSESEQKIIVLRVDFGFPYRRIAKIMGMSFNQVWWKWKKIKSHLKEILKKEEKK